MFRSTDFRLTRHADVPLDPDLDLLLEGARHELVAADPVRFFVPPFGGKDWVGMRLDTEQGRPAWDEAREIITDAYRQVAPKNNAEGRLRRKNRNQNRAKANLAKLHAAGEHTSAELVELFGVAPSMIYRTVRCRRGARELQ